MDYTSRTKKRTSSTNNIKNNINDNNNKTRVESVQLGKTLKRLGLSQTLIFSNFGFIYKFFRKKNQVVFGPTNC